MIITIASFISHVEKQHRMVKMVREAEAFWDSRCQPLKPRIEGMLCNTLNKNKKVIIIDRLTYYVLSMEFAVVIVVV